MSESQVKTVLDVSQKIPQKSIIAKQRDINSRFLTAAICDSGRPITVPQTARAVLNVRRSDGETNAFSCQINPNGSVTAPLTPWMLESEGDCVCDISIYGADETKLSTTSFTISVEEQVLDPDDLVGDENYNVLVDIIGEVTALKAGVEAAEAARVQAESGRVNAEANRQISFASAVRNANIAAATANTAAAAAEKVNISAEQTSAGVNITVTDRTGTESTVHMEINIASDAEFREMLNESLEG